MNNGAFKYQRRVLDLKAEQLYLFNCGYDVVRNPDTTF